MYSPGVLYNVSGLPYGRPMGRIDTGNVSFHPGSSVWVERGERRKPRESMKTQPTFQEMTGGTRFPGEREWVLVNWSRSPDLPRLPQSVVS